MSPPSNGEASARTFSGSGPLSSASAEGSVWGRPCAAGGKEMTWVKGELTGSGARCWLRGRKAVARWVRAGRRSGGSAAGGEGGTTSVVYDSRPVGAGAAAAAAAAAGGAGGGGGGGGGCGSAGSEAAANVLRGVGERGKWTAVVVCSVRAGEGRGARRCRRGWGEMRRMGVVVNV